jgi:hypothetical protein
MRELGSWGGKALRIERTGEGRHQGGSGGRREPGKEGAREDLGGHVPGRCREEQG